MRPAWGRKPRSLLLTALCASILCVNADRGGFASEALNKISRVLIENTPDNNNLKAEAPGGWWGNLISTATKLTSPPAPTCNIKGVNWTVWCVDGNLFPPGADKTFIKQPYTLPDTDYLSKQKPDKSGRCSNICFGGKEGLPTLLRSCSPQMLLLCPTWLVFLYMNIECCCCDSPSHSCMAAYLSGCGQSCSCSHVLVRREAVATQGQRHL